VTPFGALDAHLMREGKHARLFESLGAFPEAHGTRFAVWAPNARAVSVIGPFNDWTPGASPLALVDEATGIWGGFVANAARGALYKYQITSKHADYTVAKADPFAIRSEVPPGTASMIWSAEHAWGDGAWMAARAARSSASAPMSIYEVHLGSWMRVPEEHDRVRSSRTSRGSASRTSS
jgi:1,4-alpha-glucan branching enzyme